MVNLTRIYTRTGDAGETRLVDNSVASKTDLRVAAYGDVDEANSMLGLALAIGVPQRVDAVLRLVQNELFDVGADLATPLTKDPAWPPLRVVQDSIDRLEGWCDEFTDEVPPLRSFILPGGSQAGAVLHVARTITRRAERTAWAALAEHGSDEGTRAEPGGVHPLAITYLNRLSDLLFILARVTNGTENEVLWVPGGERNAEAPTRHGERDAATPTDGAS